MKACLLSIFLVISIQCMGQGTHEKASRSERSMQDTLSFCKVLMEFMSEANINFTHLKGNLSDTTANSFSANRGLPGAVTSGIFDDEVLRYEGIMYEGTSKEKMARAYALYKDALGECLLAAGFAESLDKNTTKGLDNYPAARYTMQHGGAHYAVLKVDYSHINDLYTVTISVNK